MATPSPPPTPIYLDHNATTPLDPGVFEAMRPHWLGPGGNAESRHAGGRSARRAWDAARESVAAILGADADEVVFTSGGTEANNLAILGLARSRPGGPPAHLVSTPMEHPAVAGPVAHLEAAGATVDRATVGPDGLVDADAISDLIRPETRLATLILAHNETGAIQPVAGLVDRADELGVPVHTDAVQAVGKIPVDFRRLGASTLAASAHKFHGPAGSGLLLVRKGVSLAPTAFGGGQQAGRRPGTPAVALAVGLAAALAGWHAEAEARAGRWRRLRDRLEAGLIARLGAGGAVRVGPVADRDRLPQTLHVGFPGLDGDALLMRLDLAGVAASIGSACASGSTLASPTLLAMGVPAPLLRSTVRFSLGAGTTEVEIDDAIGRIAAVVGRSARP